ncbi:phage head closure protein [Hymenobacter guriensis]|uniref:Phage head closure protein n=1 Tax=Hymenobacter guriensis TaxID=2793065 RepID=A0ABS0KWV0_9BACT|nr:phage head closure protein [Hymenobacter guriensis]MBG8552353.1 phage head closure protein [Hymenobacter guriensis]
MNIGKMDRLVEVQTSTSTPDSFGQSVPVWTTLGKRWMQREEAGGAESVQAGELVAINKVYYLTRWEPALTARVRLIDNGQTYDISHVAEIGRRAGLKLTALTRNDAADAR